MDAGHLSLHDWLSTRCRRALAARCRLLLALALGVHAALLGSGCVPQNRYDAALNDLAREQAASAALRADLARLTEGMRAREARIENLSVSRSNDASRIDDLVALNDELSKRLRLAGQSVETLAGEKSTLSKALNDTRARLEELRRLQAAAEARTARFRELLLRFHALVDAGRLKILMREGRMLLELQSDPLFDSGRAEIKPAGRETLREIAAVLRTMPDRHFQVAGHTDDVKIQRTRFPSNWELSTARAVEVVRLLIESGMNPANLSAAGYGEFAPVAPNTTPEGRSKNRRIEIGLVPDPAELVSVSQSSPTEPTPPPPQH